MRKIGQFVLAGIIVSKLDKNSHSDESDGE